MLIVQGVGMTHFDIGGYTSLYGVKRDKHLFLRSAEAAVFTPTMRTHEGIQFRSEPKTVVILWLP